MKRIPKNYKYHCEWCFFECINDEEKMKKHCLNTHGVTGHFKKGYTKTRTYKSVNIL